MRSDAATVDAHLEGVPAERRAALALLRTLCRTELTGFVETMQYGMPGYERDGVGAVGFANQKAYISLYVLRTAAMKANADRLAGLSVGKGCIRFRRPEQIDPEVVCALLAATVSDSGPVC